MTDENETDDEARSAQELKELAIAVISSSVGARTLPDMEDRLERYADDFRFLLGELTVKDLVRMVSLLADMNGWLIGVMANERGQDSQETMQQLALRMMATGIEEDEL